MKSLLAFLGLGILFFTHIGTRPLANPDEGRYASMGLEMVQSNDWINTKLARFLRFIFVLACVINPLCRIS